MIKTRVTLPREVGTAIESIKNTYNGQAFNIETIFSNARNSPESAYGIIHRWITKDENSDGVLLYFDALVNGYEVDKTPKQKLKEQFEDNKETVKFYKNKSLDKSESTQDGFSRGYVAGVRDTMNAFNLNLSIT